MSDAFGDLSFPMLAAAGTAVHLGFGERAVSVCQQAVERSEAMGSVGSESRITLALALCQVGRADEALAELEQVAAPTPYLWSVRALARALTADPAGSIGDAERVAADGGASYLDRVIADTAAASAHAQRRELDLAGDRFDRARTEANEAGDIVAREIVAVTRGASLGEELPGEAGHLGVGWKLVAKSLGAVVADVSGEPVL